MAEYRPDVEAIFFAAQQKPAQDRAAYLDEACGADRELRLRVEQFLSAQVAIGSFLETPVVQRAAEELAGQATTASTEGELPSEAEQSASLEFLTPSDKPDSLGRLGHYEILEVIGHGGMGIVFRALDEKLHRVVAIKVMAAQLATNATARKRFSREAQAQAAVSHDHIVTIHAVEEANGLPYLVMQYVAGMSLQERLGKSGPLQLHEILRIGMQTASGLAAAHAQGLVHRDIKPANILLENGVERVKVTDFGLARAAADANLTQSGVVAGTPQYMSPEQAEGKAIDQRTDLFSLGSVLYAMCTGRAPFCASGSMAILKRVCEETPTPIRENNLEIPDWLVAIIDTLHAKEPAQRYQSASEVAELLARHLAHVQHPSVAPLPGCAARPESSKGLGHNTPFEDSGRATHRRWAVAAAMLLLLIGGFSLTEAIGVTNLRATVIRIFTPDGTLVVEVDDPDVKVTIEGDGGLAITGAGPQEVRLKPGSYKLRADRDGKRVPLERELVTISRGDRQVVRVRLEGGLEPQGGAWVQLFNGHDLTGWKTHPDQPGKWRVENGILIGDAAGEAHLFSERSEWDELHLRVDVRINQTGKGGLFVRSEYGLSKAKGRFPDGLEASIYNGPQGKGSKERETETTGSLYWLNGFSGILVPNEEWFTMELIARGRHIIIKVNDQTTTDVHLNSDQWNRRGHIAVMQRADTVIRFRKIEIKKLPPVATSGIAWKKTPEYQQWLQETKQIKKAETPMAAPNAFVLLGGKGVAEREFATLVESVAAAKSSDSLEIRGNGPFVSDSVDLGAKELTIRAAPGSRPILRWPPQYNAHLLTTSARLVLEGLEFQLTTSVLPKPPTSDYTKPILVWSRSGPLHMANCRFALNKVHAGALGSNGWPILEVRNSQFLASGEGLPWPWVPGRYVLVNNLVACEQPVIAGQRAAEEIQFARNTWVGSSPFGLQLGPAFFDPAKNRYRMQIEASENVIDASELFSGDQIARKSDVKLPAAEMESGIRGFVQWRERQNKYGVNTCFLRLRVREAGKAIPTELAPTWDTRSLSEWTKFWDLRETSSGQGQIRFHGSIRAKLSFQPEELTPDDFRLRADSVGYRAGKDGQDLGADVDLVGPGPAYERWKKTPEYQQWLEETAQKK